MIASHNSPVNIHRSSTYFNSVAGRNFNEFHISDDIWNNYWQTRKSNLYKPDGKSHAVLASRMLLDTFPQDAWSKLRILELGCGEGHILGRLYQEYDYRLLRKNLVGVDKDQRALDSAEKTYPDFKFHQRNLLSSGWERGLGQFDLIIIVNVLHEIYSSAYVPELQGINTKPGKNRVKDALSSAMSLLSGNGYLLIFDGLEYNNPDQKISFILRNKEAEALFHRFVSEYRAFRIKYEEKQFDKINVVTMSRHHFSKFITKIRWMSSELWDIEKWESYQYFNQEEFTSTLKNLGLDAQKSELIADNLHDWEQYVELIDSQDSFPYEHILLIEKKCCQK